MEGKYKLQNCTRKEIPRLASANQPGGKIWVVAKKMEKHNVAEKNMSLLKSKGVMGPRRRKKTEFHAALAGGGCTKKQGAILVDPALI